jgi:hypothetical protein
MWLPPGYWIAAAASGAAHVNQLRSIVEGRTTKVVKCEKCEQRYAYELKRCAYTAESLQHVLATGIEAIPCPACGWFQSDMIPKARKLHRRWMVHVGLCLTLGLIPLAFIGLMINTENGKHPVVESVPNGTPLPIPWPIFLAGLVCLFAVGIGMFIWRHLMAEMSNPNDEDVEARKRYGQSRAILLSEQEATDVLAHGRLPEGFPSSRLGAVPDESVQRPPHGGVSSHGATGPTSMVSNGPRGNELQGGECLAGCVGWLIMIIMGVIGWNLWQDNIKDKVNEEMMGHDAAMRKAHDEATRKILEENSEEMRRRNEGMGKILEAAQRLRSLKN